MKNFMRRTVAFMLMVCLLLSVFPAVSLTADAASNSVTYDFVSDSSTAVTLSQGDKYPVGVESWAYVNAYVAPSIYNGGIYGNVGGTTSTPRFLAVKLHNIPGAGTYELTFTSVENKMNLARMEVYILPGDTEAKSIPGNATGTTYITTNGTKATGIVEPYSTAATSTLTVTITEDQIVGDSVVLAFYGSGLHGTTSSVQFRISKLVMTRTAYIYNKSYDFVSDSSTGVALSQGDKYPVGVESWTYVNAYTTTSIYNGGIYGNLGGTTTTPRFVAVRLHDIPGAGNYELTFTSVENKNNLARMEVYILPGDTEAKSIPGNATGTTYITKNGTKATGIVEPYSEAATSTLTVNIEEELIKDNSVVLVFYGSGLHGTASSVQFRVNSLEMTTTIAVPAPKVAEANGTQYTSVSEAITAAGTDGTVKLIASTEEAAVEVKDGVTLDLNGNTLTGAVIVSDGNIIDSATDSADATTLGGIVGTVQVRPTNTYLPLKDGTTWRFFKYSLSTYEAYVNGEAVEFWFDMDITNTAGYELLMSDAGLTVTATLSWSGADEGSIEVGFKNDKEDILAGWAGAELTEAEGKEAGMYLSVTGIPAETTVSVVPAFESTAGAESAFGIARTYTAP